MRFNAQLPGWNVHKDFMQIKILRKKLNIPDQIKIGSFTLSYKFDIYVCRREDPHNDIPNTLGHEKTTVRQRVASVLKGRGKLIQKIFTS